MADDKYAYAVDVIAHALRSDYPDIADEDWRAICKRAAELPAVPIGGGPSADDQAAAYDFMTAPDPGDPE